METKIITLDIPIDVTVSRVESNRQRAARARAKRRRYVCGLAGLVCALLVIGTGWSYECEHIGLLQAVVQTVMFVGFGALFARLCGAFDNAEE